MMKKILMVVGLVLAGLFVVLHVSEPVKTHVAVERKTEVCQPQQEDTRNKLRRQVQEIHTSYMEDCRKIQAEFQQDLSRTLAADFEKARAGISPVVDTLSGFQCCMKMSCKAAKDKICGTGDFQAAFQEIINQPILTPCGHAHAAATELLRNLEWKLRERSNHYAADVASICRKSDCAVKLPESDLQTLENGLNKAAEVAQNLQMGTVSNTIGVAMDAIFIRQTVAALLKILAKPIAKLCGSAGTAAVCAVADGPIPVGDVIGAAIAVGGTIWTVHDVYQVLKVLPGKLRNELAQGIDGMANQLSADASAEAERITQMYLQAGTALHQDVQKQL